MENCSNSTGVDASLRLTKHSEKRGYCFLSAVAMRRDPSDRAEMVNQLLQGDTFTTLERQEKWTLAKCDWDGYEGWIDNKQWRPTEDEANMSVGSEESPASVAESTFLGAPYLWGGRTIMGIDCSGLTQVCFRACGKRLLRDASQQATQGEMIPDLQQARRDDLCFFSNETGRIIHVGIYMGGGRIIHSSGQVRIDSLTDEGIINNDTQQLTHRLHSIRRVV